MKATWIRVGVMALVLLGLCAWWTTAKAHEPAPGARVVGADQVIGEDFMAAGNTVDVRARVKGDVAAAGSNVAVSGPVEGDVLAAGGRVDLTGPIGDDARAAGGTVTVTSPIKDNAMLAGGTVILRPSARVAHNADLAGGTVQIQGPVGHNLAINAGQADLSSEVGGDVRAHVERLNLQPGALVRGNLIVDSPNQPLISPGAHVMGRVEYHKTEAAAARENSAGNLFGGWLFRFLGLFVLGGAFLALSRRWVDRVSDTVTRRFGLSLSAGFIGLVCTPVLAILLCVTLIGLPIGFILLAVYGVALLLSGVFVAYEIGVWLLGRLGRSQASPYARLAVGALVVPLLTMLPWIGWLAGLVIMCAGLGALLLERRELFLKLRAEGVA